VVRQNFAIALCCQRHIARGLRDAGQGVSGIGPFSVVREPCQIGSVIVASGAVLVPVPGTPCSPIEGIARKVGRLSSGNQGVGELCGGSGIAGRPVGGGGQRFGFCAEPIRCRSREERLQRSKRCPGIPALESRPGQSELERGFVRAEFLRTQNGQFLAQFTGALAFFSPETRQLQRQVPRRRQLVVCRQSPGAPEASHAPCAG